MRGSSNPRCEKDEWGKKPPERFAADDPRGWLNRARGNLALAVKHIPGVSLEDRCHDAQPVAGKAVKALMTMRGIDFPYVHDSAHLLSLPKEAGTPIRDAVGPSRKIAQFATATRYPGIDQAVAEQQYAEAMKIAKAEVRRVGERLMDSCRAGSAPSFFGAR